MATNLTSGFVIRPLKVAPSNSTDTSAPTNGVIRDASVPPAFFDFRDVGLIDSAACQYRAAVLDGPNQDNVEYLVWSANGSNLALIDDDAWAVTSGAASIPDGTVTVLDTNSPDLEGGSPVRKDGSTRLVITDDGGRSLARVLSITVIRGDDSTQTEVTLANVTDFTMADPDTGVLTVLDNATTTALLTPATGQPPAFSSLRGDRITEVLYVISPAKFWWTRNDANRARFSWNGRVQRWEPLKGRAPINLGPLTPSQTTTLSPKPEGIPVGGFLPGSTDPDAYSMIRLGTLPDAANSTPVAEDPGGTFTGVLVVTDESAANPFDFSSTSPPASAVIGETSGLIQWNEAFVASNSGLTIWYVVRVFEEDSDGRLGQLLDAKEEALFIAPVPSALEAPFIRLGSRRPLTNILVSTDADLLALGSVPEGSVAISRSTGLLRFSLTDIAKADPDDAGFDVRYLGAEVVYDGVSLNQVAQPTRNPVALVDDTGSVAPVDASTLLYLSDALPLPGLGVSGVVDVPDGTGALPVTNAAAGLRPGGDDPGDPSPGTLRQVEALGDTIVFSQTAAIRVLNIVDRETDFPEFLFEIPEGEAYVARANSFSGPTPLGSRVEIGSTNRQAMSGDTLYFIQAALTPALYTEEARLLSRLQDTFTLEGTETLYFAIDGVRYEWLASALGAGTFTAATIAASMDVLVTGTGQVTTDGGHLVIEAGDPSSGTVEVGFGTALDGKNIDGATALSFVPGWRVDTANPDTFWLPDTAISVGLFRSPSNLDRSRDTADFQSRSRFEDELLNSSIPALQFQFLDNPPLRDVAGYDDDVFFKLQDGIANRLLRNYTDVTYQFTNAQPQFSWIDQHIESGTVLRPVGTINLMRTNVVPESFLDVLGGQFLLDEFGTGFTAQTLGTDFVLDNDGATGGLTFVNEVGGVRVLGFRGSFSQGGTTFTDTEATFITDSVAAGWRLKLLSGDAEGSYIVQSVTSETVLEVSPPFPADSGSSPISWQLFRGFTEDVFDPGLVADVVYLDFNHLPDEPFLIRLLSSLGTVPADAAAQETTRLTALVTDALSSGRTLTVRMGLQGTVDAFTTLLAKQTLGTLANSSLFVPGAGSARFTDEAFDIRVGSDLFSHGTGLTAVASFTVPIPPGEIEYLTSTGELGFADDVLTTYELSDVTYEEGFQTPSLLAELEAELNPTTGELNLSQTLLDNFGGTTTAYLVEQMVTEQRSDVAVSPLVGTFAFLKPMREFQVVEASYLVANSSGGLALDDDGNPIAVRELLPLQVRSEVATRVTPSTYSFNPTGRTVDTRIDPVVYIGVQRQNYGALDTVFVDAETNQIQFLAQDVPDTETVTISYAVFEAFGGETSYTASRRPIYRPPFFLQADQDTFTLEEDRTTDMVPGRLLRLGAQPFYIKSSSYDATTEETTVVVFPTPIQEAGTRAPGNDVVTVLSSVPIASEVDGVAIPDAPGGFLLGGKFSYEPVRKNAVSVTFRGDVTFFADANHIMELGGLPFLVAGSTLSEDGNTTQVDVTSPFPRQFEEANDDVKFSARPIYFDGARNLDGLGPVLTSEPFELVLFGETDDNGNELPGRTLAFQLDYTLDDRSGNISLLPPAQDGFREGQKLFFSFTQQTVLGPTVSGGVLVVPRFRADFSFVTIPSDDNDLLGNSVRATYTFSNPDTFFFQITTLEEYLGEVSSDEQARVQAQNPSTGPTVTVAPPTRNQDFGNEGLDSQQRELYDRDRAGRVFVDFYNQAVTAFDQTRETITGSLVGGRDGKFRHFVGRNLDPPPPGYEDPITGLLNSRNVWNTVFLGETADQAFPLRFLEDDPLVDPSTAALASAELSGQLITPNVLSRLIQEQSALVRNDLDDILLTERGAVTSSVSGFPPVFSSTALGVFRGMSEAHRFSRVYPEETTAFMTTTPGIGADETTGDPGVYAFSRVVDLPDGSSEVASTFNTPIAAVSNPTLGTITNIQDVVLFKRLPRARVVAYSATGFPDFEPSSAGIPSIIASMVPLNDFPTDPDTGEPDTTRLRSQSASSDAVFDLSTGNPDLSLPAFENLQQLALAKPDGTVIDLRYSGLTFAVGSTTTFGGVFVEEVLLGSLITLRGESAVMSQPNDLIQVRADGTGAPVDIEPGDTLFVVPTTSSSIQPSDPPTQDDIDRLVASQGTFRIGFDVELNRQTGELVDITQSSFSDPSNIAIKEILGQNPPEPLSDLEATVGFINSRTSPVRFPALEGQALDDAGDDGIPFPVSSATEHDRLREAALELNNLRNDTTTPLAVTPEEHFAEDGSILAAPTATLPPATLLTSTNVLPVTTSGYTPNSAVGDVTQYDLLLVETGQGGIGPGAQGILSVGDVSFSGGTSFIEPPRFVTQTRRGDRIRYIFGSAMVHLAVTAGSTGVVITESGGSTLLDISSVAGLFLNDGSVGTTGGLNNLFSNTLLPFPNENRITLNIFNQTTGALLEQVILTGDPTGALGIAGGRSGGGLATVNHATSVTFGPSLITIPVTGIVDFSALGGAAPGPVGPFDFSIDIDASTAGASGGTAFKGSDTARVEPDRLTFSERIDLSTTRPRGTSTGLFSVASTLNVTTVTGPLSDDVSVNEVSETNGGTLFTMLRRTLTGPVGTFSAATSGGAGDELGSVKVMGYEGFGNTAVISTSPVTFSAVPSSLENEATVICDGEGVSQGGDPQFDNRVSEISVTTGALANVRSGDVLVIKTAADGTAPTFPGAEATSKAGTYLIRDVVESDDPGANPDRREVLLSTEAGQGTGWVQVRFPTIVRYDTGAAELFVSSLFPFTESPTGHAFPSSGRVYIIVDLAALDDPVFATYSTGVVSAAYTGIDTGAVKFTGLSTFLDAGGAAISAAAFEAAALAGRQVSGMFYFPATPGGEQGLPERNTVGRDTTSSPYGFRFIRLENSVVPSAASAFLQFDGSLGAVPLGIVKAPSAVSGTLVVDDKIPALSTGFVPSLDTAVYLDIPALLDISNLSSAQWESIHKPAPHPSSLVECLLPGEPLLTDGTSDGFWASAGIFLEPSWPRPIFDLSSGNEHVVDAGNSLTASEIGMRDLDDFLPAPIGGTEPVTFEVRRIRRFSEPTRLLSDALDRLQFTYEVRRGTVSSYTTNLAQLGEVTTTDGTQLGLFDDPDVNINPGDIFRLLTTDGRVEEEVEVVGVRSGTILVLGAPGIQAALTGSVVGRDFEVYLKRPLVPHEQSAQELLELLTDEVLLDTVANYTTGAGGFVTDTGTYATSINILRDTNVTGVGLSSYASLGVQPGDYIIIDPAGELPVSGAPTPLERGAQPFGDVGVATRPGTHTVGRPSELDDNRGFYRVLTVNPDNLEVIGANPFAGDLNNGDVIFGTAGSEYVIYPTVTDSGLSGGKEGQNDLRPTSLAGANGSPAGSFTGNDFSLAPFSYQIVRPTPLLTQATVELALMMRERILSWQEVLQVAVFGRVGGSYFVFQRDEHMMDLELGVLSNQDSTALSGQTEFTPFVNDNDALSILDRRFWTLDKELDVTGVPFVGGPPFYSSFSTGEGRPVLPDQIDLALGRRDNLRAFLLTWLDFRADLSRGTLAAIRRFEAQRPQREKEQNDLLRILEGTGE